MYRRLNSEQRHRLIINQSTPEWKARLEERMDAGIKAGTHTLCKICGHKGTKAEPAYPICVNCWYSPPQSANKARVIQQTDGRQVGNGR